jgi:hypothetical protein
MRTRPLVALLGIVVGAALAVALWQGWRGLADRLGLGPIGAGVRRDELGEGQAPLPETAPPAPTAASPPLQPIPPPMPFGTVFDPLAAVEDSPALYDEIEKIAEDEEASTLTETEGSMEESTVPVGVSSLQARFGPNAAAPISRGVCPDDYPVKGNANSMIYHLPGQSTYAATIPEVCFRDAGAAEAAGFRPRKR